ncbi:invasion associated locus B family protein [Ahrensia sp. R2A130]|uniref:invasion associated locus B family protein n=1 Tax=Ahrensia sp. R2A130 TaxID=744979 RepID=UPI0001E0BCE6|nr:invasion associated locus B family protein [Ahrensia sp. R2A130]EFL87730.1 putative Invasion protein B-like protein [Ahrensia sp. R2A130]
MMKFTKMLAKFAAALPLITVLAGGEAMAQTAQKPVDLRDIWKLGCVAKQAQSQATCQLRNNLYTDNGQLIARLILGRVELKNGMRWYLNVRLPLGLDIPRGVGYRVDKGKPILLQVQTCTLKGCRASLSLSPAQLAQIRRGNHFTLIFTDTKSKSTLGLGFTLAGVTAATDRLAALPKRSTEQVTQN